jgi:hypothetical protein
VTLRYSLFLSEGGISTWARHTCGPSGLKGQLCANDRRATALALLSRSSNWDVPLRWRRESGLEAVGAPACPCERDGSIPSRLEQALLEARSGSDRLLADAPRSTRLHDRRVRPNRAAGLDVASAADDPATSASAPQPPSNRCPDRGGRLAYGQATRSSDPSTRPRRLPPREHPSRRRCRATHLTATPRLERPPRWSRSCRCHGSG